MNEAATFQNISRDEAEEVQTFAECAPFPAQEVSHLVYSAERAEPMPLLVYLFFIYCTHAHPANHSPVSHGTATITSQHLTLREALTAHLAASRISVIPKEPRLHSFKFWSLYCLLDFTSSKYNCDSQ